MNKFFAILLLCIVSLTVHAQITDKQEQPYGNVDTADLKMRGCDFEKDANAMVLFDVADITFDEYGVITFIRHKRVKIFNDNGKDEANIKIDYIDKVTDIAAETINLSGKTIEYTPVDTKLIYKQKLAKDVKTLVFTFPNVKSGSVIELQYKWKIYSYYVPDWKFQSVIPTAFSQITVNYPYRFSLHLDAEVHQRFLTDTNIMIGNKSNYWAKKSIRALSNVHSFKEEPYMTPIYDNLERLTFKEYVHLWVTVSYNLIRDDDFGNQLNFKLTDEKSILAKADSIKNKDAKIDSLFSLVKNRMTWNNVDHWFTEDGIRKAWNKRKGNSSEINLALCRLLTQAGIDAYPMVVSTSDHGIVDPNEATISQFNKTVIYVPVDSVKYYVLDATGKHNSYNYVPFDLLSTYGYIVAPKSGNQSLIYIKNSIPAKQFVFVNAIIKPDGKMNGTADIVSDTYNRTSNLKLYDDLGEKKYIDYLTDNDNELKISSIKREHVADDSLPLIQHLNFDLNLNASDENYIYFNPNLFTAFGTNPFLSEDRYSNLNFIYSNTYMINGLYKIPAGYKIDVLPANQTIIMEDKSISFKRLVGEENGSIQVRYIISRNKSYYTKDEYKGLYSFYKRMFQMLNEQIVLKKS